MAYTNGIDPDYSETNEWALFFVVTGIISGLANFLQIHFMSLSGMSFTTRFVETMWSGFFIVSYLNFLVSF